MTFYDFLEKYGFVRFEEEQIRIVKELIDKCKSKDENDEDFFDGTFRPCGDCEDSPCSRCPFDSSNHIDGDPCGGNDGMPLAFIHSNPRAILEQLLCVMNDYEITQLGFWEI